MTQPTRSQVEARVRKAVRECVWPGKVKTEHVYFAPSGRESLGRDCWTSEEAVSTAKRLRRDLSAHILARIYPERVKRGKR